MSPASSSCCARSRSCCRRCSAPPGCGWLIAYGFVARLAAGPRFSPIGQLATRVIAPRLGAPRSVAGPPKRFAQGIGAVLSVAALVCHALGADLAAQILLGMIVVAAVLESVFALCLGCHAFALLMRLGVVPESVCRECADVSGRIAARPEGTPVAENAH